MTQQHLLKLAMQGNIEAIETLINELLQPQGITAKVGAQQTSLYVALAAADVPKQQVLVPLIYRRILNWHVKYFKTAKIYAAAWGENSPAWQEEVLLGGGKLENRELEVFQNGETDSNLEVREEMERISGQLTIGDRILEIGLISGSIAKRKAIKSRSLWQLRSTPVLNLPKTFPPLIGRLPQIKSAIAFLKERQSVEFVGTSGLGKSTLLWHLGYYFQFQPQLCDGVVGFHSQYQSLADILQSIFDLFFDGEKNTKPTLKEIQQALKNKRILVFLDNQQLSSEEIHELVNSLPNLTFAIASGESRLSQTGQSLRLLGLSDRDGLTLVSHELKRSLTAEERTAFDALYLRFEGHPWLLQMTATAMRQGVGTLAEILIKLQLADSNQWLIQQVLASLNPSQLAVIAALASVGGAALLVSQIAVLSGVRETPSVLASLTELRLVQPESDRYTIQSGLIDALPQEWDLDALSLRSLNYFTAWAQKHRTTSSLLLSETDAIMATLAWGVQSQQWTQVLTLVKVIETPLALGKYWGLWEQVLKWGLQAAEQLSDEATTAWILHQLGTLHLCLDHTTSAQEYLQLALKIRRLLADTPGMTATSQNLALIPQSVTPPKRSLPKTFKLQTNKLAYSKIRIPSTTFIPLLMVGIVGMSAYYLLVSQPKSPTIPKPTSAASLKLKPISLSREKINFGNQSLDIQNQELSLSITNPNTTSLRIGEIQQIGEQADFEVDFDECSNIIAANTTCQITVSFNPLETGKHQATLAVSDSQGKIMKQIVIQGVATASKSPSIPETNLPVPINQVEEVLPFPEAKEFPQIRRTRIQPKSIPTEPTSTTPESVPEVTPTEVIPTESPTPIPIETPNLEPSIEDTPQIIDTP